MQVTARKATVQLAETFTISRGSEDEAHVIQVAVEHDGVIGYGEAAPIERYDESVESGLAWLEGVELGDDPFALDELADRLPPGEHAARAALDQRCTTCRGSCRRCRCTGCSACARRGRRPRGRSGSAIPTTWRGAPRRSRRAASAG